MIEPTDEELTRMAQWATANGRSTSSPPRWFVDMSLKYREWFLADYSPETQARIKAAMEKAQNETDPRG